MVSSASDGLQPGLPSRKKIPESTAGSGADKMKDLSIEKTKNLIQMSRRRFFTFFGVVVTGVSMLSCIMGRVIEGEEKDRNLFNDESEDISNHLNSIPDNPPPGRKHFQLGQLDQLRKRLIRLRVSHARFIRGNDQAQQIITDVEAFINQKELRIRNQQ